MNSEECSIEAKYPEDLFQYVFGNSKRKVWLRKESPEMAQI